MTTTRKRRRRVYQKASAIARAIRTSDFPHAVQIVASLIAASDGRKRKLSKLQRPADVVMVDGAIPVSGPLARELATDMDTWGGVDMRDVFEPVGPDSFGGQDTPHAPSAETIRASLRKDGR